eukprot:1149669-Pelagomonas_calceolata.AAC.5
MAREPLSQPHASTALLSPSPFPSAQKGCAVKKAVRKGSLSSRRSSMGNTDQISALPVYPHTNGFSKKLGS